MSFVEYHDPDGLYPLVSKQLQEHLPLRSLHWSTPSGPVRSIDNLHIDFVPSTRRQQSSGEDTSDGIDDQAQTGRRHQLPGLRQTPFLKIYLLRCDDKDLYKDFKREKLRGWFSEHANKASSGNVSKTSNKQEDHDAFEWLILHVVLPNTVAATEPRWTRDSSSDLDLPKEKASGGARWPGKRPRSILERLRADFNQAGKSAPDRIAQIRLSKDEVPLDVGPELPPPIANAYSESPKDKENAWTDLIAKLKASILRSLDARVTQFEADVQEKEAQRSLPGWNFNTFFVLKEGLARVFESVGLIPEALRGYEELLAGLDGILDEAAQGDSSTQSTSFAASTAELVELAQSMSAENTSDAVRAVAAPALRIPLDPSRKNYRDLIVANSISRFDFKCYLHSRLLALKLRLSKDVSGIPNDRSALKGVQDLSLLAEVCQFGMHTVTSLARYLRSDLSETAGSHVASSSSIIDTIVACWSFAAAQQLLLMTESNHFAQVHQSSANGKRATSPRPGARQGDGKPVPLLNGTTDSALRTTDLHIGAEKPTSSQRNVDYTRVAVDRASLCLLQRRNLEKVLQWRRWRLGSVGGSQDLEEEAEDDVSSGKEGLTADTPASTSLGQLEGSSLCEATATLSKLKAGYEELSSLAAALYNAAGRQRAYERLTTDIATLRFNEGNYPAVVSLLGPLTLAFGSRRWSILECDILEMHATALKALNRKDDCVRTMLLLLGKDAEERTSSQQHKTPASDIISSPWLNESQINLRQTLKDVLVYSAQLPYRMDIALSQYLHITRVDQHITLLERDGFGLTVEITPSLAEVLPEASVTMALYGVDDRASTELELVSEGAQDLCPPYTSVQLTSKVSIFGSYKIGRIVIKAGNIDFVHDALPKPQPHNPLVLPVTEQPDDTVIGRTRPIAVYPRKDAFNATLRGADEIHMGKTRWLNLFLSSGDNDVQKAQITLKSATAGLRLHTARTTKLSDDKATIQATGPGMIVTSSLPPRSETTLQIPFDTEHDYKALSIGLDISYETPNGSFQFMAQVQVPIRLLVDVNVQDVFKEQGIYSKFYVSASTDSPTRILSTELTGNDAWRTSKLPGSKDTSIAATADQPACISYQITPNAESSGPSRDGSRTLQLELCYHSMTEVAVMHLVPLFTKALDSSPFMDLQSLLARTMEDLLRLRLSRETLEDTVLSDHLRAPIFDVDDWSEALKAVPQTRLLSLLQWVQGWFEACPTVDLQTTTRQPQVLRIDFEVPSLDFFHSVKIEFDAEADKSFAGLSQPALTVGSALPCCVEISTTDLWASQHNKQNRDEQQRFKLEVDVDASAWAIVGPVRHVFEYVPGRNEVVEMTLIALQAGRLHLPTARIEPLQEPKQLPQRSLSIPTSGGGPGADASILSPASMPIRRPSFSSSNEHVDTTSRITNETECSTAGQTILVLEGSDQVAIGVEDSGVSDVLGL